MERLYRVCFDTQRNRNYITWGYFCMAKNQKEAKEKAFMHWHSKDNPHYKRDGTAYFYKDGQYIEIEAKPHMFHTDAERMTENERNKDCGVFFIITSKYASWGRR